LPTLNTRDHGLQKKIENPAYQGEWVHPEIDNPDYSDDPNLYAFDSFKFLGIDIWQVKSGSIFDNFLLSDNFDDAKAVFDSVKERREGERKQKEEHDKVQREEAEKAAEEAKKAEEAAKEQEGEQEEDQEKEEEETEKEDEEEKDEL